MDEGSVADIYNSALDDVLAFVSTIYLPGGSLLDIQAVLDELRIIDQIVQFSGTG